jgi:4-methyl-5(b-hydroxyethyl)-thiazole monophosphate biosynthesis
MKKACIFFAEGFEEIEAVTIADVLRRADIPTMMVSVTNSREVVGTHGITVITDTIFQEEDFSDAEILILPGGMPGTRNLNEHKGLKDLLLKFNKSKQKLAALCAAPIVLGGLKILEGHDAVCFPGYEKQLLGANIKYDPALKSENIITGRGPGAAFDFALTIVAELKGRNVADQQARNMLVQTW